MSELIVIGYDDAHTAEQAYQKVAALQGDFVVELRGLAIVTVDADGKTHVDTPERIVGASAASGALWGMLLGLLFFVPGMIFLGGALGVLFGSLNKAGVNDRFRSQVSDLLSPGHSAVVIMASKVTEDKFAAAMRPFGGTILKTSLSDTDEKELAEELAAR
ncbi:MAG: rane protein of uknown function [Mycobacterium sp.]|nr:rane protein of uknown function [Mycobacterium sp.]